VVSHCNSTEKMECVKKQRLDEHCRKQFKRSRLLITYWTLPRVARDWSLKDDVMSNALGGLPALSSYAFIVQVASPASDVHDPYAVLRCRRLNAAALSITGFARVMIAFFAMQPLLSVLASIAENGEKTISLHPILAL